MALEQFCWSRIAGTQSDLVMSTVAPSCLPLVGPGGMVENGLCRPLEDSPRQKECAFGCLSQFSISKNGMEQDKGFDSVDKAI